ncbi:MAG: MMPL family transporter [Actinomycetota bacterium]|nr:MAG: MMPL family transporter [Actinomycetota bacterium]
MGGLSRWAVLHPKSAILGWFVLMVVVFVGGGAAAGTLNDSFNLPDTESTTAQTLLESNGTSQAAFGNTAKVVFSPSTGTVTDPAVVQRVTTLANEIAAVPSVECVQNPLGQNVGAKCAADSGVPDLSKLTPAQQAEAAKALAVFSPISPDKSVGYLTVDFAGAAEDVPVDDATKVLNLVKAANGSTVGNATLTVGANGDVLTFAGQEPPSSELIGILVALIILLFAFGSVVGAILPILSATISLSLGLVLVNVAARWLDVATFAPILASMIGLGVGIDYSLFVINRFRQALDVGRTSREAALEAVRTAGRAVQFAAVTVVIALLGLFILRINFFNGLAVAAAVTVFMVMLGALWLLPAFLSLVGHRAFGVRMPWVSKLAPHVAPPMKGDKHPGILAAFRAVGIGVRWFFWILFFPISLIGLAWHKLTSGRAHEHGNAFARHGNRLQRHPWLIGGSAFIVMMLFAIPAFSIRQGFADDSGAPVGSPAKIGYDLLSEGFGPGSNGPFFVAAQLPAPGQAAGVPALVQALASAPDVAQAVAIPNFTDPGADVVSIIVVPKSAPQDEATSDLLSTLRSDVIPQATASSGIKAYVGGTQAITQDFTTVLVEKLPLFLAVVVGLGFLVLVVLFRSLVVPLTAVLTSLLSLGAAIGITVAVFQWGWLTSVFGVTATGPIFPFLPIMLFAILFGLSMDYQVFLVTRMQEEWLHRGDNRAAVRRGLAGSGRVVAIAAAIMGSVFAAFIPTNVTFIKLFGVALASAVLLDAFVVRLIIVPSLMTVLGRVNWWLPGWLDKIIPHVSVESEEDYEAEAAAIEDVPEDELESAGER